MIKSRKFFVAEYVKAKVFYVLVSQLRKGKGYKYKLCGKLWASNPLDATIEALAYDDEINKLPQDFAGDDYYVIQAVTDTHAKAMRKFDLFKDQRVTTNQQGVKSRR